MNPSEDMTKAAEQLQEKVHQEPRQVKKELLKFLKPAIKVGRQQGKSTKPEKRFYKKLKQIDASEEPEKLDTAIDEWVDERDDI